MKSYKKFAAVFLALFTFASGKVLAAAGPSIITQPQDQVVTNGGNATLSVVASGQSLVYQWYSLTNQLTNSAFVSGATTATLTLSNLFMPTPADTGGSNSVILAYGPFSVIVTNIHGSVISSNAVVTPLFPAKVLANPSNKSVVLGRNAVLSVIGGGTKPLAYRWYFNGVALSDTGRVSGSSTTNLIIATVQTNDAGSYQFIATNSYGSDTSAVATLSILLPPTITVQPTNRVASIGNQAVFTATVEGTGPLYYQWTKDGANLSDTGRISGANSAALTISNAQMSDIGRYQLSVTNAYGAALSGEASLSMIPLISWGDDSLVPLTLTNLLTVAAGYWHNLSINSDRTVSGWGYDAYGQATPPVGLSNAVAVAGGYFHSLALKDDGSVVGWGFNDGGQAAAPAGLSNAVAIAAGGFHSLALRSDGTVAGWGKNDFGQTTPPPGLSNVVAISAGFSNSIALKSDGTLVAWGANDYGQSSPPVGLSNVVAISAGYFHGLALKSDGTVAAWGQNIYGQTTLPGGATNLNAISAGTYHNLVLRNDGALINWGYNYYGQTNTPTGLSNIVEISAGGYHNLAMLENSNSAFAPMIFWQPQSRTVPAGQTLLFNPGVLGTFPVRFQWYFDGIPLPGETNRWLLLSNLQPAQQGDYLFVVANKYGAITSSVAVVSESPAIVTQPTNQSAVLSNGVQFSAAAIGPGLGYQWLFNGTPLSEGGRISGSVTTTLNLANAQTNDAGGYQLVVTNAYGSVTSAVATLTVFVPAMIIGQPTNRTVLVGSNASFTVSAVGTAPLTYQWYSNDVALVNGGRISGATSATLVISNAQTNDNTGYQVVVQNNYGVAQSSAALLTVLVPAQVVANPASQAVLIGSNATFTVSGSGSDLGYQWFFNGIALSDGGRISGSSTPTLHIPNVQSGDVGGYVAVVSNLLSFAASRMATLTVLSVAGPSVRYVNLSNSSPATPYLDWNTAATNIQDAVDAAVAGDLILVTNGIYNTGARTVYGAATNRVVVDKAVTVQSVNGPAATFIVGNLRAPSIRCVYLTNGASLIGFTLTNGGCVVQADPVKEMSGGGVWCESTSATISNCVMLGGNTRMGSGAFRGTLFNCMVSDNLAVVGGGGVASNIVFNSTIARNSSTTQNGNFGGGAIGCTLSNCLVVSNLAMNGVGYGGGAAYSTLINCVVSNNSAYYGGGLAMCTAAGTLVSSNFAYNTGGGAYSNVMVNCIVRRNRAQVTGASEGGGGVAYGFLTNCVLAENSAFYNGGGAYAAVLSGCTVSSNATAFSGGGVFLGKTFSSLIVSNVSSVGGGAYSNTLNNCVLRNNRSSNNGAGAFNSVLVNCTVVSNSTPSGSGAGGGLYGGSASNCIVYYNFSPKESNFLSSMPMYSCCVPTLATNGGGNITNEPAFVNLASGDLHLQPSSPCINSGNNAFVAVANDLDGNPRIAGGTVDIGAYELPSPASTVSLAWLLQYGFATDGSADNLDPDGDGLSNWQEWRAGTVPTNAASLLQVYSAIPTNNFSRATVSWQSVSGVNYLVQRASNLSAQPAFVTIQSDIAGQAGTTTYTDTNAVGNGPYFYRVGVQ